MQTDFRAWIQFRKSAVEVVRDGFSPKEDGELRRARGGYCTELFRVLHEPSFGDVVGWQVFGVRDGPNPLWHVAHRTAWNQTTDYERLNNPIKALAALGKQEPSISRWAVTPDADFIHIAYSRLQAIRIPLIANLNSLGLDGTSYELSLGNVYISAMLRWWEDAPEEWREADSVVKETLAYLEDLYSVAEA